MVWLVGEGDLLLIGSPGGRLDDRLAHVAEGGERAAVAVAETLASVGISPASAALDLLSLLRRRVARARALLGWGRPPDRRSHRARVFGASWNLRPDVVGQCGRDPAARGRVARGRPRRRRSGVGRRLDVARADGAAGGRPHARFRGIPARGRAQLAERRRARRDVGSLGRRPAGDGGARNRAGNRRPRAGHQIVREVPLSPLAHPRGRR